jgi:hypothetical protein
MYDFITSSTAGDLWINEPATTTQPGVVSAAIELVEELSQFLNAWWVDAAKWPSDLGAGPLEGPRPEDFDRDKIRCSTGSLGST